MAEQKQAPARQLMEDQGRRAPSVGNGVSALGPTPGLAADGAPVPMWADGVSRKPEVLRMARKRICSACGKELVLYAFQTCSPSQEIFFPGVGGGTSTFPWPLFGDPNSFFQGTRIPQGGPVCSAFARLFTPFAIRVLPHLLDRGSWK